MKLHAIVSTLDAARAAAEGGATVVQLRLKGLSTGKLIERGRPFRDLCSRYGVLFVVNDDVQAALELRADGVHLGREDPGAERARDRRRARSCACLSSASSACYASSSGAGSRATSPTTRRQSAGSS